MSQQLWGVDITVGDSSSVNASSSILYLTGAVLIPEAGTVTNAFADVSYLLQAESNGTKVTLASLSPARPNAPLTLQLALKGKLTLSVTAVGAQAATATGYRISVSGFTSSANGAAATASAPATTTTNTATKRKPEEAASKPAAAQQQAKKQKTQEKAAPASEEDEEDEEDEEGEDEDEEAQGTPVKAQQPKSKPATPATPTTPTTPKKPPVQKFKNGLQLQDTKIGTGKEATDRSAVSIRYRGSLASNGKVFDSNMPRGQPLRFKIGGGDVIPGFELGTKGMKVGGTRTVVIPSHLGYGARGSPPQIPGNATLVFDLELVSVK